MYALLGKITALYLGVKILHYFWKLFSLYFLPKFGFKLNLKSYGKWAVVTGSTDGIGKEYARQLAKQGFNLVLISRSLEKLNTVSEEIRRESNVEVKNIVYDFTNIDGYDKIAEELTGMEIGILVNNVGVSYEFPDYFCDMDMKGLEDMVKINCFSVLKMTGIVLPGMKERKKGIIINLSSAAGNRPTPLLTVYSASKAFVDTFSRAIQIEYKKSGIICQAAAPFFVTTKLSGIKRVSAWVPSTQDYVSSQLATVGKASKVGGCLAHDLQVLITTLPPPSFVDSKTLETLLFTRIKALRKRKIL